MRWWWRSFSGEGRWQSRGCDHSFLPESWGNYSTVLDKLLLDMALGGLWNFRLRWWSTYHSSPSPHLRHNHHPTWCTMQQSDTPSTCQNITSSETELHIGYWNCQSAYFNLSGWVMCSRRQSRKLMIRRRGCLFLVVNINALWNVHNIFYIQTARFTRKFYLRVASGHNYVCCISS